MRILITGVAGHLGSSLAKWVIENKPDCRIVGIDNLSSGFRENVHERVEFIASSVRHAATYRPSLFSEPFDAAFHFAAFAAEVLSPHVRRYTIENVWGQTASLLNALLNGPCCGRLVYASSIAVYGPSAAPFDESSICRPNDPYGIAKLASEHDIRVAGEQHGLDWCVVRPHNIYGPGQNLWDRHRNCFGIWIRAALEGNPFVIFGDGTQRRAFSCIDDILPCLWEAAFAPQASRETINLGGSEPIEIYKAVDTLAFVMGSEGPEVRYEPARHEVRDAFCTTAKSRELLSYEDHTALHVGLEHMVNWARKAWHDFPERRNHREPFEIELRRGLPAVWE